MNLTRTLIDLADHRAAAAAVEDMLRELPDTSDHAADVLAQCAALAEGDRSLSGSNGDSLASQYQQRADRLKSTGHMQRNGLK